MENIGETAIQRFWSRRLSGLRLDEQTDDLFEEQYFTSPQVKVEDGVGKSRSTSPCFSSHLKDELYELQGSSKEHQIDEDQSDLEDTVPGTEVLCGVIHRDIPCTYTVPKCEPHEMTAAGVCIDPRIVPGFTYKIRTLSYNTKAGWLFGGVGRELESIGRGYSRRITLKPLKGHVNANQDYFWSDSNPLGFAFSIQVLQPNDKFTIFDADHQPVGHIEITRLQGSQAELSQKVNEDGSVEKMVQVQALCKVDWFHEQDNNPITPLSGVCVCKRAGRQSSKLVQVQDAKLGHHHGYTLFPGTSSKLRSLRVSGAKNSDIPTSYTIVGLETYHLPVIGTYLDERIVAGFYYRVQLGSSGKKLFGGKALRLVSLGRGYAKRITFSSEHFWSDSHPEGFGFEIAAVRAGMKFTVNAKDTGNILGHAVVFRDDCGPQVELEQSLVEDETGCIGIEKKVHIDVKCIITLDLPNQEDPEHHTLRVTGLATVFKPYKQADSEVIQIEDIGLDSQLNLLFMNQWQQLVFYPQTLH